MRRLLPLALVLVFVACGEDDSPEPSSQPAAGDAVVVKMKDILFVPERVTTKVGKPVRWLNEDSIEHTVKATKGGSFESPRLSKGDVFEAEFSKPAQIDYVCTIHPSQRGSITVTG